MKPNRSSPPILSHTNLKLNLIMYFHSISRHLFSALTLMGASMLSAQDLENLWITEVTPSTGAIEVTNVGREAITTPRALPFCHRFNYQTSVPANTTFEPGQSRIYTVSFSNQNESDLWIYSSSSFGSSAALLNGLKWGSSSSIGRTGVAVSGQDWDATSSFAPSPSLGESILLTGPDPFSAANWTTGTPDLGNFVRNVPEVITEIEIVDQQVSLTWSGGLPPYQVLGSSDLQSFLPVSGVLDGTSLTLPLSAEGSQFFRVQEVEPTATFEFTFQSAWSSLAFATVPANQGFSNIVGATHDQSFSLWTEGETASSAFSQLTSDGSAGPVASLIASAITSGSADVLIEEIGVAEELGSRTFQVTVNRSHPYLSFASSLQPSPDWFVGLSTFNLVDNTGNWIQSLDVELEAYDGGVDSGVTFENPPSPTQPVEAIALLGENPNFSPSFFIGFDQETPPLAALLIRRIDNQ